MTSWLLLLLAGYPGDESPASLNQQPMVADVAAMIRQNRFATVLQQREAAEFLWVPGELIFDALQTGQQDDRAVLADFIVTTRIKRTGGTDVMYVRYVVDKSSIRFFILHGEPFFTVTQFPITPVTFGGEWNTDGETAIHSLHRGLHFTGHTDSSAPQLSFSDLHYDVTDSLNQPRLLIGNHPAAGLVKEEVRHVDGFIELTASLPQITYSVPVDDHLKFSVMTELQVLATALGLRLLN